MKQSDDVRQTERSANIASNIRSVCGLLTGAFGLVAAASSSSPMLREIATGGMAFSFVAMVAAVGLENIRNWDFQDALRRRAPRRTESGMDNTL